MPDDTGIFVLRYIDFLSVLIRDDRAFAVFPFRNNDNGCNVQYQADTPRQNRQCPYQPDHGNINVKIFGQAPADTGQNTLLGGAV